MKTKTTCRFKIVFSRSESIKLAIDGTTSLCMAPSTKRVATTNIFPRAAWLHCCYKMIPNLQTLYFFSLRGGASIMLFVISFRCISKHKCLYAHVGDRSKHDFVESIICFNSSDGLFQPQAFPSCVLCRSY